MRLIDYYNIIAAVLELGIVAAALLLCRKEKGAAGPAAGEGNSCAQAGRTGPAGAQADAAGRAARSSGSRLQGRGYWMAVAAVIAFGGFLRMWNLVGLPDGLQQDEASIGYEAYCLANYGIDRNGYHWPVYPITWGSGGGSPIMIYLGVITTKLFGSSVWSIRIVPAFLGTVTLLLFFAVLLRGFGRRTALAGLSVLTLTPWHIILSRWSLDSNTTPFWQMLATFVFVLAVTGGARGGETGQALSGADRPVKAGGSGGFAVRTKGQTALLLFAAFLFGVCMYSYGSANVVVPVTLLLLSIWGIRHRAFGWAQLIGCFVVFLVTCAPLALFYCVNFFGLPEIALDWISFPKFTSSHFSSVFLSLDASLPQNLLGNLKGLLQTLTVGFTDEVSWNAMDGYWTLYLFTWPVLFAGMVWGFRSWRRDRKTICRGESDDIRQGGSADTKDEAARGCSVRKEKADTASAVNAVMMAELAAALLFTLFIQQDINREVLLFLPLVYCLVMGLRWIYRAEGRAAGLLRVQNGQTEPAKEGAVPADTEQTGVLPEADGVPNRRPGHLLSWAAFGLILIGAISFCRDYYGGEYNEQAAADFMPGYGDAMVYADECAKELDSQTGAAEGGDEAIVYSTYDLVASPFMITLYYTKYDPREFLDTVVYRDEEAEFRIAVSFGHFVYGLPVEDTSNLTALMEEEYWGDVFVLTRQEAEQFDESLYEITWFKDRFAVVVRRQE